MAMNETEEPKYFAAGAGEEVLVQDGARTRDHAGRRDRRGADVPARGLRSLLLLGLPFPVHFAGFSREPGRRRLDISAQREHSRGLRLWPAVAGLLRAEADDRI